MGLLIHYFDIQPFIATLAGMFLARGLCYVISLESIPINEPDLHGVALRRTIPLGDYYITPAVVIALVVRRHRVRSSCTAPASAAPSTRSAAASSRRMLMGLRVARTKIARLRHQRLLRRAGRAPVLVLHRSPATACTRVGMELDAIAAVVIGGTLLTGGRGYVLGSLLGVLVLGIIQTFISFDGTLSSWWTRSSIGVLLLVFVVVQRLVTRRRHDR